MINVRISVRNLIEFILREGDIDNRFGTFSEDAMAEGARIHRMLQKRAGSDYSPEVELSYSYVEDDVEISVEGRADGIIRNVNGVTVDEIKTSYADIMQYKESKPLHLAQAKFYAYMIAEKEDLPAVNVRLSYVNIDTEEIKYFNYTFLKEELLSFTSSVLHEYVKWARLEASLKEERNKSIKGLPFPFEYRRGQDELVRQVYYTIFHKKKLFLQAPTGVGKTISTMYPAIQALGQEMSEKIFYLTAKTITRTVAMNAVEAMKKDGLKVKSVIITAKEKICPLEKTDCNPESCPYAKGHFDRINDCIYKLVTTESTIDSETVLRYAEEYKVCPFELSLDVSLFCDVIIGDYNYAFDPHAKLQRFFSDETKSGKYIFLIDEAHNLVDRAREMYSATMTKETFIEMSKLTKVELPNMSKKFDKCNKELLSLKHQCENYLLDPLIGDFTASLIRLYSDIERFLKSERKPGHKSKVSKEVKEAVLEFYFEIGHFLEMYELADEKYRIYAYYEENGSFSLRLFCVDPSTNLSECMKKARACVLFSATLLPIQYYKSLLAGTKEDYEVYAESVFNSHKKGLFLASDVTSKYTRRSKDEYARIASYIHEAISAKPGNYMVFFPSYQFLEDVFYAYEDEFDVDEVEFVVQRSNMTEDEKELFLSKFKKEEAPEDVFSLIDADIEIEEEKTLLGFCVLGGIFSEGIDLTDESLIGVIVVGTGLPQVCLEREIMKDYFDSADSDGFDFAYKYPGMNRVLQAAGRVIRTENDIGIVVLLDERFLQTSYKRLFPKEWSDFDVIDISSTTAKIEKFWDEWY